MHHAKPKIDPDLVPYCFGLAEDFPTLCTEWHAHERPQLLYASAGAMRLEVADRSVVLPPERAAWLGAGLRHRVLAARPVKLRTVYFLATDDPQPGALVVHAAPPLLREMAIQACVWGLRPPELAMAELFFRAFAAMAGAWRTQRLAVELAAPRSRELARALAYATAQTGETGQPASLAEIAKAGGLSSRTLQRRCRDELGVSLQEWLVRARLVRALELLADPSHSIGDVAWSCGYHSPAAFSRAFAAQFGSPPSAWRGR